ncbi:MAG: hypothetical protein M1817_002209 [Caeruleum heppii]|nr:MAG: hypothetical protein M1817_002209 [Caeruleum heppii]
MAPTAVQTLRQAKAAYRRSHCPAITPTERRRLERQRELEDRRDKATVQEERRKKNKDLRLAKEEREREARRRQGLPERKEAKVEEGQERLVKWLDRIRKKPASCQNEHKSKSVKQPSLELGHKEEEAKYFKAPLGTSGGDWRHPSRSPSRRILGGLSPNASNCLRCQEGGSTKIRNGANSQKTLVHSVHPKHLDEDWTELLPSNTQVQRELLSPSSQQSQYLNTCEPPQTTSTRPLQGLEPLYDPSDPSRQLMADLEQVITSSELDFDGDLDTPSKPAAHHHSFDAEDDGLQCSRTDSLPRPARHSGERVIKHADGPNDGGLYMLSGPNCHDVSVRASQLAQSRDLNVSTRKEEWDDDAADEEFEALLAVHGALV